MNRRYGYTLHGFCTGTKPIQYNMNKEHSLNFRGKDDVSKDNF